MVMHTRKEHQIKATGTIKDGKNQREVITIPFNLGPFEIVVICSLPDEGTHRFPAYIKFGMRTDWINDPPLNHDNAIPHQHGYQSQQGQDFETNASV